MAAARAGRVLMTADTAGPLEGPSAYFCRSPPRQLAEEMARLATEQLIAGTTTVTLGLAEQAVV